MFDSCPPIRRRIARILCGTGFAAFLTSWSSAAWCWETAHGNPDNTGFADVATAPAKAPLATIPNLGGIAPGAGPVIAPDGTLYVANMRGKLMSFRPDGAPGWSRDIGGQAILASPAIGSDGSIYVVGTAKVRDHTVTPVVTRTVTELYKFNSGGALLWHAPMPNVYGGLSGDAPPNIWRSGGSEAIIVPGIFRQDSAQFEAHLVAFSVNGQVLADTVVGSVFGDVTGSGLPVSEWWKYPCYFITLGAGCGSFSAPEGTAPPADGRLPDKLLNPHPAVAIRTPDFAASPQIVVSDGFHDLVGYSFTGSGFEELFRVRDSNRILLSTPLFLPDGHAMIAVKDKNSQSNSMFAGRNMAPILVPTALSFAPPTRLKDGRFAVVHYGGGISVLRGGLVDVTVELAGQSVAAAAASRGHVFVSTVSGFHTFDSATMTKLAEFAWNRGGVNTPAVGPQGHVYAIADDSLFVFGPPLNVTANNTTTGGEATTGSSGPVLGGGVLHSSGNDAPPAAPKSQAYTPPLTANGNRLFACLELDGDDCGKGDHGSIAKAFCAKQGYSQASDLDVDSKKVKAETLEGQYCTKKKCKVFDKIVCEM